MQNRLFEPPEHPTPKRRIGPKVSRWKKGEQRREEKKRFKCEYEPRVIPHATKIETEIRHKHWQSTREKIAHYLAATNQNPHAIEAFAQCGAAVMVEWSAAEKRYRLRGSYCHSRHCEPCMRAKAAVMAGNLRQRLVDKQENQYRFVTLTLAHTDQPLSDQIKRLYASFRKLRNKRCWQKSQVGGAASLEVKWKPDTKRWHPHLHVISEGKFLGKEDLSQAWKEATGDSFIVDIRKLDDAKAAAYYVAKYVTKGTNAQVWENDDTAAEWITAMKGVRSAATYGTWRGFKLLQRQNDPKDWKPVGTLNNIHRLAQEGNVWALGIMQNIIRGADPEEVRAQYVMNTGDG